MTLRPFVLGGALAIAGAFPLCAEPLPQGHFIAAPYLPSDALLPRYIGLEIDGAALDLSFVSAIPMDPAACEAEQICETRVLAATASADVSGDRLELSDVAVEADARIDDPAQGPPGALYTAPLLTAMNGAEVAITEAGFDLVTGDGVLSFYRAEPDAQMAIAAHPVAMNRSIREVGPCSVSVLTPLFAEPDPSEGQAAFLNVLRVFGTSAEVTVEIARIDQASLPDSEHPDRVRARLLNAVQFFITYVAVATEPGPFEDRVAQALAAGPFSEFTDRPEAWNAALARYGAALPDHVAFLTHMSELGPAIAEAEYCADPSFGFIAAQGG